MPAPEVSLPELDAAVDHVIARFVADGIDPEALERAKTRLVADAIYAQDSQATLARWYGAALATGQTIRDVQEWPQRIEAVTAEEVLAAARKWLDPRRAVTGYLLPPTSQAA
jgi:zinc protease